MKNKFIKNLFHLLCCEISLAVVLIVLFIISILNGMKIINILIVELILIGAFHSLLLLEITELMQSLIINEFGIKIISFNRTIKECAWDEILQIEVATYLKNPVYRVTAINDNKLYLDKRKSIMKSIEHYSKKKWI